MEKANMHSLDVVNENVKKIGNLFPECVTETVDENGNVKAAIDFEKLQENLSHATIGEGEERYQFTWPGKREAIHNANAPTNMTLRPCKAESVDFDNTENLYIEGDNLEVLKLLQENYLGKVKMIYIDPPYNTGNDFVYNDDFKEDTESFQSKSGMYDEEGNMLLQNFEKNTESNGRFHTDWLNMMYPRLKIARNLLSDDGVIFISIDDNEQENLKKICDEIFGQQNFVADIIWKRKRGRDNSARWFSKAHEYCLLFAKNKDKFNAGYLELDEETKSAYKNPDNDPRGNYRMLGCWARGTQGGVKYDFTTKDGIYFKERLWLFSKDNLKKLDEGNKLIIRGDNIYRKMFIYENKGKIPETLWDDVSNAANASDEIKKLFDEIVFDTPKPTPYIKRMIEIASNADSLILDFFSGSATTANAVLTQNILDGGKRKFICVQLPEATAEDSEANKAGYKNICEIGKERIRRAGKKIVAESSGPSAGSGALDIGFRVLKLASSNMKDVYYSPAETLSPDMFDANNVKEDRSPLDLLFQVLPECNLPLSSKIEEREIEGKTVYFVNGNYLVACFDEGITENLIKAVIDVPDNDKPYYFYMRNIGLGGDKVLDNFEQLFVHYSPTTKRKVI